MKTAAWIAGTALVAQLALAGLAEAQSDAPVEWNRRSAEHLLNRAGFGASPAEIDAAVARGMAATIDGLFLPASEQTALVRPARASNKDGKMTAAGDALRAAGGQQMAPEELIEEAKQARRSMRREDRGQLADYTAWWFDTMVAGEDPLRDRMTLFWHGYFTSSMDDVKSSYQMIQQNQLLREGALGSFAELLRDVAKDPAMLEYLDNDENKKGAPNENFAREVMELFTLGEGHYTEADIKEAARAFTGWRNKQGEFKESRARHDAGKKTVLGVTGKLDGNDVLEILLADEDCPRYVAGRVLAYLEGAEPSEARRAHYAEVLRASDYDIESMLRELFADPEFYADEVVGSRIAGPVDYLVGMARRLEVLPPRVWMTQGSKLLGQELFFPPNVKGWDGGMSWITTASFMQRGNLAGILLGVVDIKDVLADDLPEMDMQAMDAPKQPKSGKLGALAKFKKFGRSWHPPIDLAAELAFCGARTSGAKVDALADRLLAIELPSETRAYLVAEYERLEASEAASLPRYRDRRQEEDTLRRLAHLILSLPEAQLN